MNALADSLETIGALIVIFILLPAALAVIVALEFIAFCGVMVFSAVMTSHVILKSIRGTL
jgi:hypothetical protein